MKRIFTYLTLVAIVEMAGTVATFADDLTASANETIAKYKQSCPEMASKLNTSAGYAVFPSVGRGGLVIGGEHGKGVVYQNYQNCKPCQPIGKATVSGASIGAQIGGEKFNEVVIFETPQALEQFKEGKTVAVANANAVVGSAGVGRTSRPEPCGARAYVLDSKGLMVQAALGTQKLKYEGCS